MKNDRNKIKTRDLLAEVSNALNDGDISDNSGELINIHIYVFQYVESTFESSTNICRWPNRTEVYIRYTNHLGHSHPMLLLLYTRYTWIRRLESERDSR